MQGKKVPDIENTNLTSYPTPSTEFYGDNAARYSNMWADRHDFEHCGRNESDSPEQFVFPPGRLQSLYMRSREMLAGKFDGQEFVALLNCYVGDTFHPGKIDDMLGFLLECHVSMPLFKKVEKLSPLERYTLANLLELSWHCQSDTNSAINVAETLGLIFSEAT